MPIRLNFEGVSVDGFQPWPENEPIEFTIFNITQAKGEASKEPYLKFEFKAKEGNRKAWSNFSLQPQALWRLKKLLVDLGEHSAEDLEGEFEFETADILGKEVILTFGPERDNIGKDGQPTGKKTQDISSISVA